MSFHEVQFPPDIAYGATGGPAYATAVVEAGGGFEKHLLQPRITPQAQPVKPVALFADRMDTPEIPSGPSSRSPSVSAILRHINTVRE